MRAVTGAVVGLLAATGVWVAVVGWTGVGVRDRPLRSVQLDWRQLGLRFGLMVPAFAIGWAATTWWAAGVAAAGLAYKVPLLISARDARAKELAKTEALASWAEMLRDVIASHA